MGSQTDRRRPTHAGSALDNPMTFDLYNSYLNSLPYGFSVGLLLGNYWAHSMGP